jgi:hypothetical protein
MPRSPSSAAAGTLSFREKELAKKAHVDRALQDYANGIIEPLM